MVTNPFIPQQLIGRQRELEQIGQILADDGDLMVAGVSGSGRRSLIRWAAQQVGAKVIELDCLRATHTTRFLSLLAEGLLSIFFDNDELDWIDQWSHQYPLHLERSLHAPPRLIWPQAQDEWSILQALLTLPQAIAEQFHCRVVFVFQNFPHIRSWDRSGHWEAYLRQEIQRQSLVNYVVIATVPESWVQASHLRVILLAPLQRPILGDWIADAMAAEGLKLEAEALEQFLDIVQGHIGDAIALARRIWLEYRYIQEPVLIQPHHVHRNALALVEDLSVTFESLLLLLPPIQARVLESLAIDPTDSPQSRDYIRKHQLSRGGSLQGALIGLEQKGLVYGPEQGYRIALPLLGFWLKTRIA